MKRKKITIEKYTEKMNKIIAKNLDIDKTFIKLLDEANKYEIIDKNKEVK